MNRILKQFLIFLSLLLALIVIKFPRDSIADYFAEVLKKQSNEHGAKLEIAKSKYSFPLELTFENINLLLPSKPLPLPITVEKIKSEISIFSLFALNLNINSTSNLYQGTLRTNFKQSILSSNTELYAEGEKINLELHPILKTFSLKGFDDLSIFLQAKGNETSFKVSKIQFSSTAGKAKGKGSITAIKQGLISDAQFNFDIELTSEGARLYSAYFALAANKSLDIQQRSWRIDFILKDFKQKLIVSS